MENNIEERLKIVLSVVFDIPIGKINHQSSSEAIEAWDSVSHMNLVIALEEEFDIQFEESDILEMQSFEIMVNILSKNLKK